jgi:hypothetical protein
MLPRVNRRTYYNLPAAAASGMETKYRPAAKRAPYLGNFRLALPRVFKQHIESVHIKYIMPLKRQK